MKKLGEMMTRVDRCIMSCTSPVVTPGSFGPEGQLCEPHLVAHKKNEEERAKKKADQARRAFRDFIHQRVDAAIPTRYATMEAVTGDETDADMGRIIMEFNRRMRTRDNAMVISTTIKAVCEALTRRGMVILFAGPTGTGKSHMLAFALRMLAANIPLEPIPTNPLTKRGGDGLFTEDWEHEGSDPFVMWESSKRLFEAAKRNEDLRPYEDVAVLALDDIGNEPRRVDLTPVHNLVWERYDQRRLTIGSTGFVNPEAVENMGAFFAPLAERYDQAFVRRLTDVPDFVRVIPMLPPA